MYRSENSRNRRCPNEEVEENWTENDKKELIEEYTEENNCYKTMVERIKSDMFQG